MNSYRSKLTALAIASLAACAPVFADDAAAPGTPLPTAIPVTPLSGSLVVNSPYTDLQEVWDSCFSIRSTGSELLDEGRYAPARQKWVDYYASTIEQAVANAKAAYGATQLPADVAGNAGSAWTSAANAIAAMEPKLQELKNIAATMKTPTDDKYPAAFWKPARDIMNSASDLDKAIVQVLGAMEQSGIPQPTKNSVTGGVTFTAKSTDVEALANASKKIDDVTQHLFAELDRFNLGFGPPPTQPLKNEFYQGAFTKQEILSQYKYMPSFVFTTDPEVARFTYRLPPRKNMLATYARQLGKLLNLMDGDMLSLQTAVNGSGNQALTGPWKKMADQYVDARTQYLSLYNLLNTTTDDQLKVDIRDDQTKFGTPVVKIRDDMDRFRDAMNDFVAIGKNGG